MSSASCQVHATKSEKSKGVEAISKAGIARMPVDLRVVESRNEEEAENPTGAGMSEAGNSSGRRGCKVWVLCVR